MSRMTIEQAISHARETAEKNRANCERNTIIIPNRWISDIQCAEEHEQLAEWLEELIELRAYKEKMEMQYIDDIDNPLEPLKLQSALQSEIFKYEYRKEHKPQEINILDYTVMHALKYCLEEQIKKDGAE